MVFDGDEIKSPKGNKRQRYHESEKMNKREDRKADLGDQEQDGSKGSQHLHSHRDRSKELREDEKYRRDRASTDSGRDRYYRASSEGDYRKEESGSSDRGRREDVRYEKRRRDDASHRDDRYWGEYEKRRADDVGRRDRRDERDSRKRKDGDDMTQKQRVDTNDHTSRYDIADEQKGGKHHDIDARKGREVSDFGKRRTKDDDTAHGGEYERDRGRRH